ncbi:MAG: fasciclin domain-containing protein [Chloroherpetonaceae bacterium]|nr:fasciclin domain-containing protein [Chloroherpetonaceae bacterium]MCS7210903.1 fasciclin domain-containing protein [Chloroherpetonaceae bacterium]MDW8020875.1 fasciclin domain-containing protein [Chloroherpetonaceae bacterium]MDW8466192.1 fasciclin domain-containing protein [Chloroherpetonaceae bacterium]
MKTLFYSLLALSLVAVIGCGPSKEELAKKEKQRIEDSLRRADSLAKVEAARKAAEEAAKKKNIVETAVAAGSFTKLVEAVKAAGLDTVLAGPGPFTVFAPTDEAFSKVKDLDKILKDQKKLKEILTYHVVPAKVMAADVKPGKVKTVSGKEFEVKVADGKVTVDNANVTKTDIECTNGVIHVIDAVIVPKK